MTDHGSCILSVTHGDRRLNTRVSHDNTKTTRFVRAAAHDDDDDDDDDDDEDRGVLWRRRAPNARVYSHPRPRARTRVTMHRRERREDEDEAV